MRRFLFLYWMACLNYSLLFAQKDSNLIVFQHANLIDGISKKPINNVTLVVEHGKIKNVDKNHAKSIVGAIVIDLKGKWVLPGYIDAHVHFLNLEAAQRALTAGITTARTMQCDHFLDISIRDAHRSGRRDLPDIVAAGYQIRPDMSDAFYEDFPELVDLKPNVHGVENVRRVVRALISRKVDHIKVLATKRAGTPDTDPLKSTFTYEELRAIVDESTKAGLYVAAHAHGDEGAAAAVAAGVRSIEHGSFLSDLTLNMMKSRRVFFDPTFSFWTEATTRPLFKENPILAERMHSYPLHVKDVTGRAFQMGISVIGGTDLTYTVPQLDITNEAIKLNDAGLPSIDVIYAITYRAAVCLGIANRTGSIKKGMEADMVVIGKNPLKDITALKDIIMVLNDGKIAFNRAQ